jgi:hypothetical protein
MNYADLGHVLSVTFHKYTTGYGTGLIGVLMRVAWSWILPGYPKIDKIECMILAFPLFFFRTFYHLYYEIIKRT